ncbi:hypothetical protein KP509_36G005900 [Ceratopteris richardii]|uniref:indole-3-glycerol-phosphate synthase n=1 Tax=Ceratopteris richardii TaxID=49495 RepID=A0A8T2QAC8_CERRI|nr:hypothetical protein KP509_36G005900 [Ceratopteris richardii]
MTLLLHKSGVGGVRAELDRSGLQAVLQTKQRVLQSQLSFFQSQEQLQSRLTSLPPSPSPHLLLTAIRNSPRKIAVIVEVARLTPAESPEDLAARCRKYGRLGIDAISVCTDEETSPDGLADLKAVCSVSRVPVIRRDWFLHPLQIAETREAGAAALPLVCTVLGNGLPALYSYAHYLGLDSIVEF